MVNTTQKKPKHKIPIKSEKHKISNKPLVKTLDTLLDKPLDKSLNNPPDKLLDKPLVKQYVKLHVKPHIKPNIKPPIHKLVSKISNKQQPLFIPKNILHFVFIIPSYNNSKWYIKNIDSVVNQTYPHWRAIYIDDLSNDNTFDLVKKYVKTLNKTDKFTFIQNKKRRLQSYSRYIGYQLTNDDEICILLDGDDWLIDNDVLHYLNQYYNQHNLDATYQSYVEYHKGRISYKRRFQNFPKDVIINKKYRTFGWISYHLRTCKSKFIKNINFFDFIDPLGNFWASHTDLIESYCFLEQTNKHKSSNRHLMVYNRDNSSNYNNNSHNSDQIEKSYRNIVSTRIKHRIPYSNTVTKNQICICNGESDDLIYILNKYNLELRNSHNLLVLPFSYFPFYQKIVEKYTNLVKFDKYSDISSCNKSQNVSNKIAVLMYSQNDINLNSILINQNVEYWIISDGSSIINPNKIPNSDLVHLIEHKSKLGFNQCLLKMLSLTNSKWFVMMTINNNSNENIELLNSVSIDTLETLPNNIGIYLALDIAIYRKKSFFSICHMPNICCNHPNDQLFIALICEKFKIFHSKTLATGTIKVNNLTKPTLDFVNNRKNVINLLNSYYSYSNIPSWHNIY